MFSFIKIIFSLSFLAIGITAHTQEKLNVIKLDLSEVIGGNMGLSFERAISPKFSLQLATTVEINSKIDPVSFFTKVNGYETKRKGFHIIPEARFYPFGKTVTPKGIYLGGYARYTNTSTTFIDNGIWVPETTVNLSRKEDLNVILMGGILGHQWILQNGINIDFSAALVQNYRGSVTYNTATLNEASSNPLYETVGDELLAKRDYNSSTYTFGNGNNVHLRLSVGYAF